MLPQRIVERQRHVGIVVYPPHFRPLPRSPIQSSRRSPLSARPMPFTALHWTRCLKPKTDTAWVHLKRMPFTTTAKTRVTLPLTPLGRWHRRRRQRLPASSRSSDSSMRLRRGNGLKAWAWGTSCWRPRSKRSRPSFARELRNSSDFQIPLLCLPPCPLPQAAAIE
jgi:hypothetical protein